MMRSSALQAERLDQVAPGDAGAAEILRRFLESVQGSSPDGLLEMRFRRASGGMGQCFFATEQRPAAIQVMLSLSERTDVYFGVAPRRGPRGGRSSIESASVVWADCDTREAVERAAMSVLPPSVVVRTSEIGRHAYWCLAEPQDIGAVEELNRRLAVGLGADGRSSDGARILRPPGTLNYKHQPPARVVVESFDPARVYPASELAAVLPPPVTPPPVQIASGRRSTDPLHEIPPAAYARVLLGVTVDRTRKIQCPFHEDRTPSLHLYPTAEQGWYCFGCGRGSSIYDMAAAAWDMGTRGAEFVELRQRLLGCFRMEGG